MLSQIQNIVKSFDNLLVSHTQTHLYYAFDLFT